jgi:hypothetical protein
MPRLSSINRILCYSGDAICCIRIHPTTRVEKQNLQIGEHDGVEIANSVYRDNPVTRMVHGLETP